MDWVTFVFTKGAVPHHWLENELRQMFRIPPNKKLIPFVHSGTCVSNTSARVLTIEADPDRPATRRPSDPGPVPSGGEGEYRHNQQRITITGDLTQIPFAFNRSIRRSLSMVADATSVWSITLFYDLIEGTFEPDTHILERFADRRKMDRHDDDSAGESFFRMGQVRQMGDADPGT